jgi:serine/threonine protein kinase/tetratricopeptide (TPR) repeat protein
MFIILPTTPRAVLELRMTRGREATQHSGLSTQRVFGYPPMNSGMELERISHFKVDRLLGVGGMGEVYLAEDATLKRKVALKLLPERFTEDENRVRRFQREAQAASALNHPGIITIYEFGQAERRHYIATEYIEGQTLRGRIMSEQPVRIAEVLDIGIGVSSALSAAHEAGIIHRDIKPENVMLRPDGYVKVLDFGLAKLVDGSAKFTDSQTGAVMGTLLYLSPEQARGQTPDARSDVYSLGAVLYELITRQPPIVTDSFIDLALAIATRDPKRPSTLVSAVPAELDRIVMKALHKNPSKRYQSAREMQRDLETLRGQIDFEDKLSAFGHPDGHHSTPSLAQQQTALMSFSPQMATSAIRLWRSPVGKTISVAALTIVAAAAVLIAFARAGALGERQIDSVAVLPFINSSGDPNSEYLSDGISESITDSLSQLPNLQVTARSTAFRYKGKAIDPMVVGGELRVRGIVTGQLMQRGDTLIIRCSLTDVKRGTQIWGEQYNRRLSDALAVQQEMAQEISNKLRMKLSGEEKKLLTRRTADSNEAFQLYLKGRYYRNKYNEDAIRKSIGFFNQAIEIDPTYALAHAGLADAYYGLSNLYMPPREAMPRAREAARRALTLDDSLPQAHTELALVMVWFDWNFRDGEHEFLRAIDLNPGDADTHRLYADFLTATGRFDRALAEKKRAEQLDPLSVPATFEVARTLYFAGRLDDADEQARRALELDEHLPQAYAVRAWVALAKGRNPEAMALSRQALALSRAPQFVALWGYINGRLGNRDEAQKAIAEIEARPNYASQVLIARVNAGLGNREEAIRRLQRAYNDRSESIVWLGVDPSLASLRDDPRFQALVKRVGV